MKWWVVILWAMCTDWSVIYFLIDQLMLSTRAVRRLKYQLSSLPLCTLQVDQGLRVLLGQAAQTLKLTASVSHSPVALPPAQHNWCHHHVNIHIYVSLCTALNLISAVMEVLLDYNSCNPHLYTMTHTIHKDVWFFNLCYCPQELNTFAMEIECVIWMIRNFWLLIPFNKEPRS